MDSPAPTTWLLTQTSADCTHSVSGLARFHVERTPHHNLQRGPGKKTEGGPSQEADAQMVSFLLALPVSDFDVGISTSKLLCVTAGSLVRCLCWVFWPCTEGIQVGRCTRCTYQWQTKQMQFQPDGVLSSASEAFRCHHNGAVGIASQESWHCALRGLG